MLLPQISTDVFTQQDSIQQITLILIAASRNYTVSIAYGGLSQFIHATTGEKSALAHIGTKIASQQIIL